MKLLHGLHNADIRLFFRVQRLRWLPVRSARIASRTADGYLYAILPLLFWLLYPQQGGPFCAQVALAFAIERPLYFILKKSCRRRRPPAAIPGFTSIITAADEFSFPSGHTCGAFLFVTLLCAYAGLWLSPLYLWACFVGLSRIVLGVHFPTDILTGAVIGSSIALAVAA